MLCERLGCGIKSVGGKAMTLTVCKLIVLLGLAFDVLGAWYISRGLMRKSKKDLENETGFCFGPNDDYIIGGLSQKIECKIGFYILLLGFTLQGISSLLTAKWFIAILSFVETIPFFIICLVIWFGCFFVLEKMVKRKVTSNIKDYVKDLVKQHINQECDAPYNVDDMKRLLGYLKISVNEGATPEEIWSKLKKNTLDI